MAEENPAPEASRGRRPKGLDFLALAALCALVRLAFPVGVGLFLGALIGFMLQPVYERLRTRGWGANAAAATCTLGAMAAVCTGAVLVGILVVTRGVAMVSALSELLGPGGALRAAADRALKAASVFPIDGSEISSHLQEEAMSLGSKAATGAGEFAGATFSSLLTVFFMSLTAYAVLRHWNKMVVRLELALPFEQRHTHALLDQFRKVGRQVLWGTLVTGVVQGLLAGVGYWITGVADPAFFGVMTAVASLVPAVGTMLVWVPIGIYRMATGHVAAGLIVLVYAAVFVVGVSDYFIRPKLVGGDKDVPVLLTFVSLFGGVEVFGLVGLVLGPVIVALSLAVLKTYQAELAATRAASPPPSIPGSTSTP
jgi:predicted PurR-regulated permease PerM